jgi:twinkle protein
MELMNHEESQYTHKEPCPKCGSKDNLARYSDGHGYCFGCEYYEHGKEDDGPSHTGNHKEAKPVAEALRPYFEAEVRAIRPRGISEETCRHYGYRIGSLAGSPVHLAPYYKDGSLVGLKVRGKDKAFSTLGDMKSPEFFGQQQVRATGKMIVVTEGEIDCLSVSQCLKTWPVVSLPSGAPSAAKAFRNNLEFLDGYETVVIWFDNDEPGIKASKECAELLPPGKAKIVQIAGAKDANELLLQNRVGDIVNAVWGAKPYRPDGIVSGTDLWDVISKEDNTHSIPYPWEGINKKTMGLRKGEMVTVTAGSGIGKSALVREVAYHLLQQGETVGMLMLEENTKRTALGLMGLHLNKPIHINKEGVSNEELKAAFNSTVGSGSLFLYDSWGSSDVDNLLSRIRYMARGLGCGWIVLDHLSIVVSGSGDGDERRLIDNTMTALRKLVEELQVGMLLVSHLKRPEGNKGHEEGASTSLSQLRGSHAIAQLSDIVIGLERNQQSDSPDTTTVRVLKNRFTGDTGVCVTLNYSKETGRLSESPFMGEKYDF